MAKDFWKGKVVLLTGASSGIGAEMASQMASRGAILGLVARRQEELELVADRVASKGSEARTFPLDVTDPDALRSAASDLRDEFGRIDLMIANAGIAGTNKETQEINPAAVAAVINVNLLGAVNAVGAVLPEMLEAGSGHLVAISSLAGFRGLPKSAAYSSSKAGMNALFESLRLDFKPRGVNVSVIQPGFIKTPLTAGRKHKLPFLLEVEEGAEKILKAIESNKAFYAFPWPLATFVRLGKFFPVWLYDRVAGRARYRE